MRSGKRKYCSKIPEFTYRYGDIVAPGEQTTPLATRITMKDIGEEEYAGLGDINVEVGCYGCGTEDMDIDDAWGAIKEYYGV